VQRNGCSFLGQRGIHSCHCPLRLSYKTVDSYIGKLRALFHALGRDGEWDKRLGLENPAADKSVKNLLAVSDSGTITGQDYSQTSHSFHTDKLTQLAQHLERTL
jgi:hypothetical protein